MYLLSTVVMDVKILFVLSLSTGGWISCSISITSSFNFILSCVVLRPLLCRFICTLSVAGEFSGRYFLLPLQKCLATLLIGYVEWP